MGGSGEGGTKKQTTVPWAEQIPHLKKGMGEAERLYDEGGPQYFEGNTLASRSPLINQSEDAMMGYAGGNEFQDMMDQSYGATTGNLGGGYFGYDDIFNDPNVGGAYQQALSGDPNPYTADAARAMRQDMAEDYSGVGGVGSQIRNAQVSSGQYGGSTRGDLMNRRGQDELNENMVNATAQMYNQSYGDAQNRMLTGLGQAESARAGMGREDLSRYGTAMGFVPQQYSMEMGALGVPGQVGQSRQAYDQAQILADKERWDYNQNLPYTNLQNYLGNTGGSYGSATTNSSQAAEKSKAQGAMSGAMSGAMAGASLGPWGALAGGVAGGAMGYFS